MRIQRGEPARGQRWQGVSFLRNLKPPTAAFPRSQFCMGLPSLHRADNLAGNRSLLTFLPPEQTSLVKTILKISVKEFLRNHES